MGATIFFPQFSQFFILINSNTLFCIVQFCTVQYILQYYYYDCLVGPTAVCMNDGTRPVTGF